MPDMKIPARPPWYAFLYRAMGAQGTFFLWVVTLPALWWTGQGALLRVLNREPERRTVAEVAGSRDLHNWVWLQGVRIELDPVVLGLDEPGNGFHPRATILIDADDPAAAWWKKTRELADQDAAGEPGARDQLSDRDTQLPANPLAVLPRARTPILPVSAGGPDPG